MRDSGISCAGAVGRAANKTRAWLTLLLCTPVMLPSCSRVYCDNDLCVMLWRLGFWQAWWSQGIHGSSWFRNFEADSGKYLDGLQSKLEQQLKGGEVWVGIGVVCTGQVQRGIGGETLPGLRGLDCCAWS